MYVFLTMMRQRNKNYFVEWALINSGAMYGATISGITKLAIYFETNMSRTSFMERIKQKSNYDDVLIKSRTSLQNEKIGIAIFDNTQKSTNIFYQRKGKCGECIAVTSRMFDDEKKKFLCTQVVVPGLIM